MAEESVGRASRGVFVPEEIAERARLRVLKITKAFDREGKFNRGGKIVRPKYNDILDVPNPYAGAGVAYAAPRAAFARGLVAGTRHSSVSTIVPPSVWRDKKFGAPSREDGNAYIAFYEGMAEGMMVRHVIDIKKGVMVPQAALAAMKMKEAAEIVGIADKLDIEDSEWVPRVMGGEVLKEHKSKAVGGETNVSGRLPVISSTAMRSPVVSSPAALAFEKSGVIDDEASFAIASAILKPVQACDDGLSSTVQIVCLAVRLYKLWHYYRYGRWPVDENDVQYIMPSLAGGPPRGRGLSYCRCDSGYTPGTVARRRGGGLQTHRRVCFGW